MSWDAFLSALGSLRDVWIVLFTALVTFGLTSWRDSQARKHEASEREKDREHEKTRAKADVEAERRENARLMIAEQVAQLYGYIDRLSNTSFSLSDVRTNPYVANPREEARLEGEFMTLLGELSAAIGRITLFGASPKLVKAADRVLASARSLLYEVLRTGVSEVDKRRDELRDRGQELLTKAKNELDLYPDAVS